MHVAALIMGSFGTLARRKGNGGGARFERAYQRSGCAHRCVSSLFVLGQWWEPPHSCGGARLSSRAARVALSSPALAAGFRWICYRSGSTSAFSAELRSLWDPDPTFLMSCCSIPAYNLCNQLPSAGQKDAQARAPCSGDPQVRALPVFPTNRFSERFARP
jgi:hypothetical protein